MYDRIPPPVNNACVPDIYNKLDADAIERTKVINTQLSFRLNLQDKVLSKYRNAAEQRYMREKEKVRKDLRNICRRMPNYADIPRLETKVKRLRKERKGKHAPKHDCVFTTEPLDMKGISEKDDKPFCDRFFTHHLPTKSRFYQDVLYSVKKGMSMPDLRSRPNDRYTRVGITKPHHYSQDNLLHPTQDSSSESTQEPVLHSTQDKSPPTQDSILHPTQDSMSPPRQGYLSLKVIPAIKSLDDNFVSSKSTFTDCDDDDDDIKTI